MFFEAFRQYGGPTFYEAVRIPWEGDLLTSGLIFCFAILILSFYVILPGVFGKERLFAFTRITVSLFIGAAILVCNFAMTWETAKTQTVTKYRAGTGQDANVTVGVNIGFRGMNITLKGDKDQIQGETINYNENFNWEGLQGRLGFGPFAGQFNRQFRAAQLRGVPLPILTVAEYFTLDGEGIRWGRYYRLAGWYSHIALWLAFPLWILSNILFFILLRYGAYFLALTGLSMITSNIIWTTLRNPLDLKINFTSEDVLVFSYGPAFWVCLITGIICVVLGIVVFLMDKLFPAQAAVFFSVDVLQDSENIVVEDDLQPDTTDRATKVNEEHTESITVTPAPRDSDSEDDEADGVYMKPPPPRPKVIAFDIVQLPTTPDAARPYTLRPHPLERSVRSSEHRFTRSWQRPRRRDPPPRPPHQPADDISVDYVIVPGRRPERNDSSENLLSSGSHSQNSVIRYQNPGYGSVT
ncbi:unnamed protein product [Candidula unifasciata]|uniref:Dual oxidase maturation factor 1 n=1 Tax=Candidula unifasciata TaxID=100452 RepID=A0A8S3ZHU7_9EUPU|nr:unnamed protein product [Candidula unifasciata]